MKAIGVSHVQVGASGEFASLGARLYVDVGQHTSNVTTALALSTITIPANTLNTVGASLRCLWFGTAVDAYPYFTPKVDGNSTEAFQDTALVHNRWLVDLHVVCKTTGSSGVLVFLPNSLNYLTTLGGHVISATVDLTADFNIELMCQVYPGGSSATPYATEYAAICDYFPAPPHVDT